jgi:hypothetical protein
MVQNVQNTARMQISERQKAAAHANGAKSRGSKTEAEKLRASRNSPYARTVLALDPQAPVFVRQKNVGRLPIGTRGGRSPSRNRRQPHPPRSRKLRNPKKRTLPRWILVDTTVSSRMRLAMVTTNTTVSS